MPSKFVHEWMKKILKEDSKPFINTVKEADWVDILWWLTIGLIFSVAVSEIWKI